MSKQLDDWVELRGMIEDLNSDLNPILKSQYSRDIDSKISSYEANYNIWFNYYTFPGREK